MSSCMPGVWLVLCVLTFSLHVQASTLFSISECREGLVAKNYDWGPSAGYAFFNDRDLKKHAYVSRGFFDAFSWESHFSSVTFSSLGREFSEGGMNEHGLVVESAPLSVGICGKSRGLAPINEFEWVQYILDTSGDIDEAIANAQVVEIRPLGQMFHYMVCDQNRLCAVFEYVGGKLEVYSDYGGELPVATLTNSAYSPSVKFLREHVGFGGSSRIPQGASAEERFVLASYYAKEYARRPNGWTTLDYTWAVLDNLSPPTPKWQTVYTNGSDPFVSIRAFNAREFSRINLSALSRPCNASQPLVRRMFATDGADAPFVKDERQYTHWLLKNASRTLPWLRSESEVDAMSDHAFSFACK